MSTVFIFLTLASVILLLVGIFKPRVSLFWLSRASTWRMWLLSALFYSLSTVGCLCLASLARQLEMTSRDRFWAFVETAGPENYPREDTLVTGTLRRDLLALAHDSTLSAAARQRASTQARERARHTFSAMRLFRSYWADSARANRAFRNRAFYVLGKVSYIDCYASGGAWVTLNNDYLMGGANCFFADEGAVGALANGQTILVRVVGRRTTGHSANLDNCVLLRTWPAQPPSSLPYE
jgi:hypothetical protein